MNTSKVPSDGSFNPQINNMRNGGSFHSNSLSDGEKNILLSFDSSVKTISPVAKEKIPIDLKSSKHSLSGQNNATAKFRGTEVGGFGPVSGYGQPKIVEAKLEQAAKPEIEIKENIVEDIKIKANIDINHIKMGFDQAPIANLSRLSQNFNFDIGLNGLTSKEFKDHLISQSIYIKYDHGKLQYLETKTINFKQAEGLLDQSWFLGVRLDGELRLPRSCGIELESVLRLMGGEEFTVAYMTDAESEELQEIVEDHFEEQRLSAVSSDEDGDIDVDDDGAEVKNLPREREKQVTDDQTTHQVYDINKGVTLFDPVTEKNRKNFEEYIAVLEKIALLSKHILLVYLKKFGIQEEAISFAAKQDQIAHFKEITKNCTRLN